MFAFLFGGGGVFSLLEAFDVASRLPGCLVWLGSVLISLPFFLVA